MTCIGKRSNIEWRGLACLAMGCLTAFVTNCGGRQPTPSAASRGAAAASGPAVRIGGRDLTTAEVERRYRALPYERRRAYETPDGGGIKKFVEDIADWMRFDIEGQAVGLGSDDEAKFELELAREEISRRLLLRRRVLDLTIQPDMIREYFEAHRADYAISEMVKLREILVTPRTEETVKNTRLDDARSTREAEAKTASIQEMLEKGQAFGEVAREYSEDPSAAEGGEIGWVSRAGLDAALVESIWGLAAGGRTGMLKSGRDYYFFECVERRAGRQMEFDDVKSNVVEKVAALRKDALEAEVRRYTEALREKYPLEVLDGKLSDIGGGR